MNRRNIFAFFISAAVSASILTLLAYFWLNTGLKSVSVPAERVPYKVSEYPDSKNILFTFGDNYGVNFNLDFEHNCVNALIIDNPTPEKSEKEGYTVYKTVTSNYKFIREITDTLGGIAWDDGITLTGVQVCEVLSANPDDYKVKARIIKNILKKISKNGFSKEIILCIINTNKTNLSYPDCYDYANYMDSMCENCHIINGGGE